MRNVASMACNRLRSWSQRCHRRFRRSPCPVARGPRADDRVRRLAAAAEAEVRGTIACQARKAPRRRPTTRRPPNYSCGSTPGLSPSKFSRLIHLADMHAVHMAINLYFQATVFDSPANGQGIFYERPVDELIVLDESKKMLYCVRKNSAVSPSNTPSPRQEDGEQRVVRLVRPPFAAAAAAARWRKKCRQRRAAQRLLQQQRDQQDAVEEVSKIDEDAEPTEEAKDDEEEGEVPHQPVAAVNNKEPDTDIEERILRRREMAHLFHWYYPEGGWGWTVLACACAANALATGVLASLAYPLGWHLKRRFMRGADGGDVSDADRRWEDFQVGERKTLFRIWRC